MLVKYIKRVIKTGLLIQMAKGIYHKYNVLLYRVLGIMFDKYPNRMCARELAEELGINPTDITDRVRDYVRFQYLLRTKKRYPDPVTGRKVRLLRLSKHGAKTYLELKKRIKKGSDLNRKSNHVEMHVDSYFGITLRGAEELGITPELIGKMNYILTNADALQVADSEETDNSDNDTEEEYTMSTLNAQYGETSN
jgi:DNA-binding MarR family transcriptional regulator